MPNKPGMGKNKGSAFEREAARRLSLWLSAGMRDDLIWRSSMSGGRATLQLRKDIVNQTQSGDLSAIGKEAFEFCEKTYTECKHYKDLSISRSMLTNVGGLYAFWKSTQEQALKYKKRPLLIARQNRYPTLAVVDSREPMFNEPPVVILPRWAAALYLFDDVTRPTRVFTRRT
jgi:hypothetical protein